VGSIATGDVAVLLKRTVFAVQNTQIVVHCREQLTLLLLWRAE